MRERLAPLAAAAAAALVSAACAAPGSSIPAPAVPQAVAEAPSTAPPPAPPAPPAGQQQVAVPQQPAAPQEVPWVPGRWSAPAPEARPTVVWIPRIEVAAPVVDLGLTSDGRLEVPSDPDTVGWYTGRARPGEDGPTVLAGHVDSRSGPAVFFRLGELRPNDLVHVAYDDGYVATFVLRGGEQVDKDAFPTDRVYGETSAPTIRLVTCDGDFDRTAGHYEDNLILYGEMYASWTHRA